jgi:hypothetical protein
MGLTKNHSSHKSFRKTQKTKRVKKQKTHKIRTKKRVQIRTKKRKSFKRQHKKNKSFRKLNKRRRRQRTKKIKGGDLTKFRESWDALDSAGTLQNRLHGNKKLGRGEKINYHMPHSALRSRGLSGLTNNLIPRPPTSGDAANTNLNMRDLVTYHEARKIVSRNQQRRRQEQAEASVPPPEETPMEKKAREDRIKAKKDALAAKAAVEHSRAKALLRSGSE